MQILLIAIGVVLIACGLFFALGGVGTSAGRGAFRDLHIEGPAWLVLVGLGLSVVLLAALRDWGDDADDGSPPTTDRPTTTSATTTTSSPTTTSTTSTTTTTTTEPTADEPAVGTLRRGHAGERVRAVEEALAERGFLDSSQVDGVFDATTESAVEAAQAALGLAVDGLAGPRTHAALGLDYLIPRPDAVTLPCDGRWVLSLGSTRAQRTHPDDFRDELRRQRDDLDLRLLAADSCASLAPGTWVVIASSEFASGEDVSAECRERGLTSRDDCLGIPLTDDESDRERRAFP